MTSRIHPVEPENGGIYNPEVLLPLLHELNMEALRETVSNNTHPANTDIVPRPVPSSSVSFETSCTNLPTYEEAITPNQGMTTRTRVVPSIQNVLHHIDYSSDPEEARIHYEISSPSRPLRS